MLTPITHLSDLYLDDTNSDIMHVSVGVEHNQTIEHINFVVSLSYMGLRWKDDFGFEFSKDIQRDMNSFYEKYHRIPLPQEYKLLTERHLYKSTSTLKKQKLNNKLYNPVKQLFLDI